MQLRPLLSASFAPINLDSLSALRLVSDFDIYYPEIDRWFETKVLPGIVAGTRRIIVRQDSGHVCGLAILKKESLERKICTIWVRPSHRGAGLGQRLVDESLEWLQCERPMLTVPEEALASFVPLLKRNDFELIQRADGYYRSGRCEYVFNGELPVSPTHSIV